jgi:hypothetical protein
MDSERVLANMCIKKMQRRVDNHVVHIQVNQDQQTGNQFVEFPK